MSLRLYNTLTRRKDVFTPIDASNVRLYVCGPTVYDEAHIGNARPVIVFDVLFRLLRHLYGADHVTYVRNITDVDDKINARAAERGITIRELTEETARVFDADVAALGTLKPNEQPRATDNIPQMIDLIERLIARGHAYTADGHVLFSVPSLADYGRLSRRPLDEMIAGARVDVAPYKRADSDFVLWKPSPPDVLGWDSPWGRGRPGWHIECSAMAWRYLGDRFDIHGGGIDLVFPHHENELAQTCGAFGHDVMANVWMHNGFLQVEGEKMSKSLGNFFTIGDLLRGKTFGGRSWPGVVLRYAMLTAHYRQPIDWTLDRLQAAEKSVHALWLRTRHVEAEPALHPAVEAALSDDLNTPQALAELNVLLSDANRNLDNDDKARVLLASCAALGLRLDEVDTRATVTAGTASLVETRIDARLKARAAKNWSESDRIRDELAGMGVALKDNKDGTTSWEMKR